jgi:hypothetical protein
MTIFRLSQDGKKHALRLAFKKFRDSPTGENAVATVHVIHSVMKPDCGLGWKSVQEALYNEFGTTTNELLIEEIEKKALCLSKQS